MAGIGAIALRLGLYLDLMALFGIAAFALYALRGNERRLDGALALGRWLWGSAALGVMLSVGGLLLLAATMAGVPVAEVDAASIGMILADTSAGAAWLVRMAALLFALVAVPVLHGRPVAALRAALAAGLIALASLAWGGHGMMDDGASGWLHLAADILHLLGAGIWVGALLALALLLFRQRGRIDRDRLLLAHRALDGFALVGTIAVTVLVASGLVNSWFLIGPEKLFDLPDSLYGQLLIAKLVLFAAMVLLAAGNRYRLVPALARSIAASDHAAALAALRLSLFLETACVALVLALVAWLGTLEPLISAA